MFGGAFGGLLLFGFVSYFLDFCGIWQGYARGRDQAGEGKGWMVGDDSKEHMGGRVRHWDTEYEDARLNGRAWKERMERTTCICFPTVSGEASWLN